MNSQLYACHVRPSPSGGRVSRPKVLVIHPEASVCSTLRRWLEDEGYACRTATSHLTGCEHLDREVFAALLTEVQAPRTSELTFLLLAQHLFPATAIILIVPRECRSAFSETLELDPDGFVLEPLERGQVTSALATALGRRRRTHGRRRASLRAATGGEGVGGDRQRTCGRDPGRM